MRAHAGAREQDHDLIELAAGRADVVVLHRLGPVDDLQRVLLPQAVDLEHGEDQVDRERRRARHAAAGDVAVEHRVETPGELHALAAEDVLGAEGEARPRIGHGLRLRHLAEAEVHDAVLRKVPAEHADAVGAVGPVGHPDEAVGADAEELGAVVVAVLHAEAEARRGAADAAAVHGDAGFLREPRQRAAHGSILKGCFHGRPSLDSSGRRLAGRSM